MNSFLIGGNDILEFLSIPCIFFLFLLECTERRRCIIFWDNLIFFLRITYSILLLGSLCVVIISSKILDLFSYLVWINFASSSFLKWTNYASILSHISCFSLIDYSSLSYILFSSWIWCYRLLMIFFISFSFCSCSSCCSTTKLFSCLYLFLYLVNPSK